MKNLKMTNKRLDKKNYEILKNIEILSFIDKEKLKDYISFIIKYLKKYKINNKLITYLNKNWFINYDIFNYSDLLKYKIN